METIDLSKHFSIKGYTVLPIASGDVECLTILCEPEKDIWEKLTSIFVKSIQPVHEIGKLKEFWDNENIVLEKTADKSPVQEMHKDESGFMNFEASVTYYEEMLKNLNAKIDVNTQLNDVKKVAFSFTNVLKTKYSQKSIGEFIITGKYKGEAYLKELKYGKGYIIHEVLQTNNFSVKLLDENNLKMQIAAKLEVLKKNMEGNLNFKVGSVSNDEIKWTSEKYLTIGFKASPIIFDKQSKKFRITQQIVNIEYLDDNENQYTKFTTDKDFVVLIAK